MQETILWIVLFLCIALCIIQAIVLHRLMHQNTDQSPDNVKKEDLDKLREQLAQLGASVQTSQNSASQYFERMAKLLREDAQHSAAAQEEKMDFISDRTRHDLGEIRKSSESLTLRTEERLRTFATENEQKLSAIRQTVQQGLQQMQQEQTKQLDAMRKVVDEKMQQVLDARMKQAFSAVNERLEQVYKGLGEMQTVAAGVTDLKKVLSNVKTRGILGEVQLGAILKEILSPEQYDVNVAVKEGSSDVVEYAVKLPGDGESTVYLPIDAKFPGETYASLQDAYDSGSADTVASAAAALIARLKSEAKDIRSKYIDPPRTTDFAVMFLPFEGLYAEAVNRGMVEELQNVYHVNLAGPSTMAALLNSLQMGFRTLAIQKRSSEVWQVLGAVKTEFEKFGDILEKSQQKLQQVNSDLDTLIGARSRAITRKLRSIEKLDSSEAETLIGDSF